MLRASNADPAPLTERHRFSPAPRRVGGPSRRSVLRPSVTHVFCHVAAPVLIGAAIYLSWRTPTLLVFQWVDAVGLHAGLTAIRTHLAFTRPYMPDLLLFSVPDALWVYAL